MKAQHIVVLGTIICLVSLLLAMFGYRAQLEYVFSIGSIVGLFGIGAHYRASSQSGSTALLLRISGLIFIIGFLSAFLSVMFQESLGGDLSVFLFRAGSTAFIAGAIGTLIFRKNRS